MALSHMLEGVLACKVRLGWVHPHCQQRYLLKIKDDRGYFFSVTVSYPIFCRTLHPVAVVCLMEKTLAPKDLCLISIGVHPSHD
jgi:hypothetical protein